MSELPYNWEEIKADKAFWELLLKFKAKDARWSNEDVSEDESELHLMAIDFVLSEGVTAFSVSFEHHYGWPTSSTVQEVAGKFYVPDWAEPVMLCGPYATVEEAAMSIIEGGNGDSFTGVKSSLPIERLHALCEAAAGSSDEFMINGVLHVRTMSGFVPKTPN
jgi:hypothetical protein